MGWLMLLLVAAATALALLRFARLPRPTWDYAGAALLVGIAGYAWQGVPAQPGSPAKGSAEVAVPDSVFAEARPEMMGRFGTAAQWMDYADTLHRMGQDRLAVTAVRSGLRERPNDPDLWVGLGNALILHSDGLISPAARLAFDRAARIAPDHPGPPFFLGLAYAQAGQPDRAAATWRALLERAPADAGWREQVAERLAEVERQMGMPSVAP